MGDHMTPDETAAVERVAAGLRELAIDLARLQLEVFEMMGAFANLLDVVGDDPECLVALAAPMDRVSAVLRRIGVQPIARGDYLDTIAEGSD